MLKYLLLMALAFLLYHAIIEKRESFVPYNSFEALPETISAPLWKDIHDKFGTLVQTLNNGTYSASYELSNLIETFLKMLNDAGYGKYIILSVGESRQFTLVDVLVQDIETLAITKFIRVDFSVDSINPFKIQKVIITPDTEFVSSQSVQPQDSNRDFFRIKNPLHLFSPYKTTDNDMAISSDDTQLFNKTLNEKETQLLTNELT